VDHQIGNVRRGREIEFGPPPPAVFVVVVIAFVIILIHSVERNSRRSLKTSRNVHDVR